MLESRRAQFACIHGALVRQVSLTGLDGQVEVLHLRDDGSRSHGAKRNDLLRQAGGEFVDFVDDDEVIPRYVSSICEALRRHPDIDCVGIKGIMTFRGRHPMVFIHSVRYRDYSSGGEVYTRPPYHLNPIRRSIGAAYHFRDVSYSEDVDWALRICKDRRLRSEEFVDQVLYYYRSRRYWSCQWLLDLTELVRRRLGLRLTNRFLLRRGV